MDVKIVILIVVAVLVLLITAGLAVVNFSAEEMFSKYKQTEKYPTKITPVMFANLISRLFFNNMVIIKFNKKLFSDSFSSNGTLVLCEQYANSNNLAGLSICAHELGHAFQFKNQKAKMKKYCKKVNFCKVISKFIIPLIILSCILLIFDKLIFSIVFFAVCFVIFVFAMAIKISTIKIEKEASEIALDLLKQYGDLTEDEIKKSKLFLNSAKLTYVADLLKSMLKWTGLTK